MPARDRITRANQVKKLASEAEQGNIGSNAVEIAGPAQLRHTLTRRLVKKEAPAKR